MKNKKIIIFLSIIVGIIIVLGLYFRYIDSARVRNGIEPKFTIKIVNDNGNKVTYWGLGYKVIRYPSISPSEPYKNNKGVKYGNWFIKYKLNQNKEILEIVDTTKNIKDFVCAESLEEFYSDEQYSYYFSCIKSSYILVKYKDGSQITVSEALKNGEISISDLPNYNINYYKYEK
ncbi:MAG: hypothetical protein E7161_01925 [Firmicutes bacterium]|nr:hypothetical protein [Bacillota bacterium]